MSTVSRFVTVSLLLLMGLAQGRPAAAQPACVRISEQDSTLNNLVDPPGYRTGRLGDPGDHRRIGTGPRAMIVIAGLGFGAGVFDNLVADFGERFTIHTVTLPGFGGTPAPPSPPEGTSFGQQTWTNGTLAGLEALIAAEGIDDAIVVGHWLVGTQLAVRLAVKHPDTIRGVILLAGTPRWFVTDPQFEQFYGTPELRVRSIDQWLAPRWFRTVTRETWDDNNFLPGDYAVNPIRGLRLWREAARPPLHVWVRWLCEFNAQDLCADLDRLSVPTLVLRPGLEGLWHDGSNYMRDTYCHTTWNGCAAGNAKIRHVTIPDSRACLWFDQPEAVGAAIGAFLDEIEATR